MERIGKIIFLCELQLYTYTESGRITCKSGLHVIPCGNIRKEYEIIRIKIKNMNKIFYSWLSFRENQI